MKGTEYVSRIAAYRPESAQEESDRRLMLDFIRRYPDTVLTRGNEIAHVTSSSLILNRRLDRVLMVYHNLRDTWSWTGGHADGDGDLLAVALREAREETGIERLRQIGNGAASLEILPVWAHVKRGKAVGSHLHLNVSYLFEADDSLPLRVAEDENSAVGWIAIDRLAESVREKDMLPTYEKLLNRTNVC